MTKSHELAHLNLQEIGTFYRVFYNYKIGKTNISEMSMPVFRLTVWLGKPERLVKK